MKIAIRLISLFVVLATATSCINDTLRSQHKAASGAFKLSFTTPKANEAQLRSSLNETTERTLMNMALFVFDKNTKRLELNEFYNLADAHGELAPSESGRSKIDASTADGTNSIGDFKNLNLTEGQKIFILIANLDTPEVQSKYGVRKSDVMNCTTLQQLEGIISTIETNSVLRETSYMLMSARKEGLVASGQHIALTLRRIDAKITINVKSAQGITFIPRYFSVHNAPKKAYLIERKGSNADASATATDFFEQQNIPFDITYEGNTTTFYTLENRKAPKKAITHADLTTYGAKQLYHLRDKQTKTPSGTVNDPSLKNGDYVFAPSNGTYITIEGSYHEYLDNGTIRSAETQYTFHLGYTVPKGSDAAPDVNDYNVERNTHYTYNITVNGVDEIIVEAKSTVENEKEHQPGAEGDVYDPLQRVQLDSYNEQRFVRFMASEYNMAQPRSRMPFKQLALENKEDMNKPLFAIEVHTPYTVKGRALRSGNEGASYITFSVNELMQLYKHDWDYDRAGMSNKKTDLSWVHVAVPQNISQQYSPDQNKDMLYAYQTYSYILRQPIWIRQQKYDRRTTIYQYPLYSLEQFLLHVLIGYEGNEHTLGSSERFINYSGGPLNGTVPATFFFDEFHYSKNPITNRPFASDNSDGWKKFTNTEPRAVMLYCLQGIGKDKYGYWQSPDRLSTYAKPLFRIDQLSIKTFFTDDIKVNGKNVVWGINNYDIAKGENMTYTLYSSAVNTGTELRADGYINTLRYLMGKEGADWDYRDQIGQKGYWARIAKGKFDWKNILEIEDFQLKLAKGYFRSVDFVPIFASRPSLKDGADFDFHIHSEDIKWYNPSILQLGALALFETALPQHSRLDKGRRVVYRSSTSYKGANANFPGNPYVIIRDGLFSTSVTVETSQSYGLQSNINAFRSYNAGARLVRELANDEGDLKERFINNRKTTVDKEYFPNVVKFDKQKREFYPENIDKRSLRHTRVVRGELPRHTELNESARIYQGGFKVGKTFRVPALNDNKDYFESLTTLIRDINIGKSPCKVYSEEADKSDMGKWRVPNVSEVFVMANNMTDWTDIAASGVYMFLSSTEYSRTGTLLHVNIQNNANRRALWQWKPDGTPPAKLQGYAARIDINLKSLFTVVGLTGFTSWEKFTNDSGDLGNVRCVRDL